MARNTALQRSLKIWVPWLVLTATWAFMIAVINPSGEFMVNDDWSYVKSLETLRAGGKVVTTGWGPTGAPGGPSLLVHLLWGDLFCRVWGFSLTTLRLAVLTLGVLGSGALLLLFQTAGISPWLALLATLTVVANPLFLSQCFTYMSDITFTALVIFALLGLGLGVKKRSLAWISAGLILTLGSILTRQIGVVILPAFILACWVHPVGAVLGRQKMLYLGLGLVLLPWMGYEFLLAHLGSSPMTQHQVVHNIVNLPRQKGFPGYLVYLYVSVFHFALGYLAFFISPLFMEKYLAALRRRAGRYCLAALLIALALGELAIFAQWIRPPVAFPGNVIFNFGIGPVLLKDIYVLGLPRLGEIASGAYYLVVAWGGVAALTLLAGMFGYVRMRLGAGFPPEVPANSFLALLAFLSAFFYIGIITLTSFHDRYLIPALVFLVIWLVLDQTPARRAAPADWRLIPGFLLVMLLGLWSTVNVHNFMEMKRSLKKAHDYVLQELRVNPCTMDGGFEFNGYYCYRNNFRPRPGLSWWWVSREDYLITLGLLPGYRVLKTFPFQRYGGPPGAIHLLQPLTPAPGHS